LDYYGTLWEGYEFTESVSRVRQLETLKQVEEILTILEHQHPFAFPIPLTISSFRRVENQTPSPQSCMFYVDNHVLAFLRETKL